MKKLAEFSLRHPVAVVMVIMAILLLGFISFRRLGVDLFPDLNTPRLFIELTVGDKPPEEIERVYVEPIESQAIRQRNVSRVSSISRVGSAQITVEYRWNTDMDEAFLYLQKALERYRQYLEIDELVITQHDPNAEPIVSLGLSHPEIEDMNELRRIAENYIRNELIRLEGIAEVELAGEEEREIVIETDEYLLEAYGLTPEIIAGKVRDLNENASGGSIEEMGTKYIVKGVGIFQSIEEIERIVVAYRSGDQISGQTEQSRTEQVPIFLRDIAKVEYRNKEPESIVRIDGKRCLGLDVYKETKYNTVRASSDLRAALGRIQKALPGYEIAVVRDQGQFITGAINEVKQTALWGVLLAVLILYVFLRRLGTTAIISIAIPISVVATFNLMYFNGLTLNVMTLGGLALGAGMLVDNAIVVVESILRNIEAGSGVREAAIEGTAQVGGAITASTITTIVVFLPIVYLHGAAGELFKDQAWTVAFSLLSSLFVAILVIPMLSHRLLRRDAPREVRSVRFGWYVRVLPRIVERRWTVIGAAAVLVAAAAALIPVVGSEFVPNIAIDRFAIEISLPEGTRLQRMERTASEIERAVTEALGGRIETIYTQVGSLRRMGSAESAFFRDENAARIEITLRKGQGASVEGVIATLSTILAGIPDLESRFVQDQSALQATLGTESAPITIEIKGEDLATLEDLAGRVKERLAALDGIFNVETSFEEGRPQVEVVIDRLRAGLYGIGMSQIGSQLQDKLMGKSVGYWEREGEHMEISLRMPEIGLGQLDDITIESGERKVPLGEIARIRTGYAPKEINRINQVRVGLVTAHHRGGEPFDRLVRRIENNLAAIDVPPDYRIEVTGEEQRREESFRSLRFALILSIILVYMVLASQFESLVHPFTILLTIPLAVVGAVFIFLILGRSFNIMAYIGIIMLAGIAVNDSIILVDAINQLRRDDLPLMDAITRAGQRRIRPIIMTSITTILALLPLTFGFGEGAALRAPMALAVIGGLISSTVLTLFVIPCVYYVLDGLGASGMKRRLEREG